MRDASKPDSTVADDEPRRGRVRRQRGDVGIRDIAAAAGVSVATVSRVINGHPSVSAKMRDRVEAIVARLAYRPNIIARSLRTQKSASLGVVVPNISNAHFTDAVRAMQDQAEAYSFTILVMNSDNSPEREATALRSLIERQVDGIALTSASVKPTATLRTVLAAGIPVVAMDRIVRDPRLDRVTVDTRAGTREAVLHLAATGRRRIAFIAGPAGVSTATEKWRGYRDGLRRAGLDYDADRVLPGDYSSAGGERQARALLELPTKPDALVVANNLMALGAMRALLRSPLRIPAELAVFGYDDTGWTDVIRPTLSVVAQPTADLGRQTVRLLWQRITGRRRSKRGQSIVLPTTLILRESTEGRARDFPARRTQG